MTSPSRDPVQEAREEHARKVRYALEDAESDLDDAMGNEYTRPGRRAELIAAFESALRASLVERVVGKVEGMRLDHSAGCPRNSCQCRGFNEATTRVLAVLRAELNSGEGGK